jgi:hypothetical protein
MPRYEIVAHITSELDCQNAEEAAAIVRRQIADGPAGPNQLLHLAVWREEPAEVPSPVAPRIREKLVEFFTTLEQSAAEAEETFRGQVEAILMGTLNAADESGTDRASPTEGPESGPDRKPE